MSTPVAAVAESEARVLHWQAPQLDLAAALAASTVAQLTELGVIAVSGADADTFLQAQLTNDARAARTGVIRNGYCTPKGRLLAVFDPWHHADTHYLQLPRELLPAILKRLSMFVLRAKVKLSDDSAAWQALGVVGPGSAQLVARAQLPLPEVGATTQTDELIVWRLADGARARERFQLMARTTNAALVPIGAQAVHSGVWWWAQIDAAAPTIWRATQETFVPQMINLEVLGGVNFRKGCYPGQEVVARSQYLGKLRRRMHLAHVPAVVAAGTDVFVAGDTQPVGTVVMCAAAPGGGADLLFECPQDALARPLHAADGGALQLRELPYPLVDVTA